ncbi:hypothetical protein MUG78_06375 [Gordonia alkaliphila]|uniref:hypothetical protein n=1 Tax=Gordonia alkaliphila TaxID=1053547 RepID=UPI001FF31E45|nr:hypothetical protein [Gordonia alkaliphila]MCK0439100.1 hypothetical protein [Gordonia alkaliphila]
MSTTRPTTQRSMERAEEAASSHDFSLAAQCAITAVSIVGIVLLIVGVALL